MRTVVVMCAALLLCGCKDWSPFPSGALEGPVAEIPASWEGIADDDVVQFETNPAEPYSVNLWLAEMEGALYVHAGDNHAQWVQNMEVDPNVRVRMKDAIYELRGERVVDQAEFDRFGLVWEAKYGNTPRNDDVHEVFFYRLVPRG